MQKNIYDMTFIEMLECIKEIYGNNETTNLYIRCLDCDKYIPVCEWEQHKNLLEQELCSDCDYD